MLYAALINPRHLGARVWRLPDAHAHTHARANTPGEGAEHGGGKGRQSWESLCTPGGCVSGCVGFSFSALSHSLTAFPLCFDLTFCAFLPATSETRWWTHDGDDGGFCVRFHCCLWLGCISWLGRTAAHRGRGFVFYVPSPEPQFHCICCVHH